MGEIREGLGEMADPADLITALVQVGLLKRAFTGTELAAETDWSPGHARRGRGRAAAPVRGRRRPGGQLTVHRRRCLRRRCLGDRDEFGDSALDAVPEHADVRGVVVVAGDPELQVPVVGEDPDDDAERGSQRDGRRRLEQPPSGEVQGVLRAGHVGRRGVDAGLTDRHGLPLPGGEQHRRREPGQVDQSLPGHSALPVLDTVHLPPDLGQPGHRVRHPHRQVDQDPGHPVVVHAALISGAHRDRHHRPDHPAVDLLAAAEEQLPEPPGDRGQHDVVDRPAQRPADQLHVGERRAGRGPPPMRAVLSVQRRIRRWQQLAGDARESAGRLDPPFKGVRRRAQCAEHARQLPDRAQRTDQRLGDQLDDRGLRAGPPGGSGRPGGVRLVVEQHGHQVGARDAVDHAVVDLRDDRPPAVLQALHHPDLPQRARPVQML